MVRYSDIIINQGETFSTVVYFANNITNVGMNISGYTVESQLRKRHYSANASGNLTCTISNSSNGQITLSMTAANTANLSEGRHVYDVKVTSAANVVTRVVEGIAFVTSQATR